MAEPKELIRKKFVFANIALAVATVVTILLRYEGSVFVQLFGIVVTGYLIAQAYVDASIKKEE
jgi:hypothetical protein